MTREFLDCWKAAEIHIDNVDPRWNPVIASLSSLPSPTIKIKETKDQMRKTNYQLSPEDVAFVERHQIPLSKIFNGNHMATGPLKDGMKSAGAWIAVNARACQAAGHTIRTNGGHCAQCAPKTIAFAKRHTEPGFIYVATSSSGGLVKVGMTINIEQREAQLNGYSYGSQRDWKITHVRHSTEAGKEEFQAHRLLSKYSTTGTYYKDGDWVDCYELFSCSNGHCIKILSGNTGWDWSEVSTGFDRVNKHTESTAKPRKNVKEDLARQLMAEYYKTNKESLHPSVRDHRERIVELIMEGFSAKDAFMQAQANDS